MPSKNLERFLTNLKHSQFDGDIQTDLATRTVTATDNSIYQVLPQAVLYPKHAQDIQKTLSLAKNFPDITFTARGGGTGTDGQSLSDGVILDCSKYMNNILEINTKERWARVQAGVVLDQLNDALKPHGLHFPVSISTADRATLGGMVNTDACGKGSLLHGRTSDNLLALKLILSQGDLLETQKTNADEFTFLAQQANLTGKITQQIQKTLEEKKELIKTRYPNLARFATGYNLAKIFNENENTFNLNYLLAGSEGTLGIITEIKLTLKPLPAYNQLIIVHYPNFDTALKHAATLAPLKPSAIETINETLLTLAKTDILYRQLANIIEDNTTNAINLIEFAGNDVQILENKIQQLTNKLAYRHHVIFDKTQANALWQLRKKSVGLLGKTNNKRQPIPFVEDTVVSPRDLPAFIQGFRKILDKHQLQYGMFGHADTGCIHVRPALDMQSEQDEKLLSTVFNEVYALIKHYNGILWGEHGLGFRSEYNPDYFGEELYREFQKIKTVFDPSNKLNPGKIATPLDSTQSLFGILGPLRGHENKKIPSKSQIHFADSLSCNGNASCFNFRVTDIMCPSYKGTNNRIHSPKGRAELTRAWLNTKESISKPDNFFKKTINIFRKNNFSDQVYDAMSGCLGCKACQTQCPINVNIPDLKAKFLQNYHAQCFRPPKDFFIKHSENLAHRQSHFPRLWNFINACLKPATFALGLIDTPKLSAPNLKQRLPQFHTTLKNLRQKNLDPQKNIILLQDMLTSFYDTNIIETLCQFLKKIDVTLHILPFQSNAKPLHVKGYLTEFKKIAKKRIDQLFAIDALGLPIIGLDPALTLTYRDEYPKYTKHFTPPVLLFNEWLAKNLSHYKLPQLTKKTYLLLPHCSEKAMAENSLIAWQKIFDALNLKLNIIDCGCCGMAGSYGHEKTHQKTSKIIFDLSWREHIKKDTTQILSTGFSCRYQIKRLMGEHIKHPIEVLLHG